MRKLGFCSISAMDRSLGEAAELAAGVGLDGLEVTARPPHLDPEAGIGAAREAGRIVREAGIEVIAYGSYLGRRDVDEQTRPEREIAIAEALETPLLRVWAEPTPEVEEEEGFRRVVALLRRTCELAAPAGLTVVVERHLGSFADTRERIERLLDAVDRENLALNYQVLDYLRPHDVSSQADDAARLIRHARYLHLKNYRPGAGGGGRLEPGGSLRGGVLDYRSILKAVLDGGYEGPMTIEFVSWEPKTLEEKLAADVEFVRQVLSESGRA